jgi:hypothetical protein
MGTSLGTVYGVNYTKAFISNPTSPVPQGESGGKVKCLYDSYTLPSAVIDDADVVNLGGMVLPAGARVVDATIKCASLGTTGKLILGYAANGVDAADADAFINGTSADAGGQAILAKPAAGDAGIFKKFTANTQVTLGCTEISTNTTVKIEVAVFYVLD